MIVLHRPIHRFGLALLCALLPSEAAMTQVRQPVNTSADNLMVVLRESTGANKQDETLRPVGKMRTKLDDGKEIEFEMAAFEFIGDMHIRFVFDGPQTMPGAKPQDLARLHLGPAEALRVAIANIKRVYGAPQVTPWTAGLLQVQGKSPDLDSSYFLDREFWQKLAKLHPDGLVVSVPRARRHGVYSND